MISWDSFPARSGARSLHAQLDDPLLNVETTGQQQCCHGKEGGKSSRAEQDEKQAPQAGGEQDAADCEICAG